MSFGQKNAWPRAGPGGQINPIFQGLTGQQFGMLNVPNIQSMVNQVAFGNMIAQQGRPPLLQQPPPVHAPQQRAPSPQNKKRSFTGVITKVLDTYGFIDDEVFFQTAMVTGGVPVIGARCVVEAIFKSTMPFQWSATSVHIIPDPQGQMRPRLPPVNRWEPSSNNGAATDLRPREDARYGGHIREDRGSYNSHSRRASPPRRDTSHRSSIRRSPPPRSRPSPGKSPIRRVEKRERSPRPPSDVGRRDSPPRRRARVMPRYACYQIRPVTQKTLHSVELRQRYNRLYIPSDFVSVEMNWIDSFALGHNFNIGVDPVVFHSVHKDVDIIDGSPLTEQPPPADEDHRFSVRVLLLSHNGIVDLRRKVFGLLPDGSVDESSGGTAFSKVISFLAGVRGRSEYMTIGGAYSPSLDGPDPLKLATQIRTAVRTTRDLIGLDLSQCSTWYKIAHVEYYRAERDRIDNVLLLLPDTSTITNLTPTPETYAATLATLNEQLASKLAAIDAEEFVSTIEKRHKEEKKAALLEQQKQATEATAAAAAAAAAAVVDGSGDDKTTTTDSGVAAEQKQQPPTSDETTTTTTPVAAAPATDNENGTTTAPTEAAPAEAMEVETSNGLKLDADSDLSNLRVADLREHLSARGLDTKGVKNVLLQRLQQALIDEQKPKSETPEEVQPKAETEEEKAPEAAAAVEQQQPKIDLDEDDVIKMEVDETITAAPDVTIDELVEKEDDDFSATELEEIRRERERFESSQKERKASLNRHYIFPETPCILVFPNKYAKAGRFDCRVVSLQSLLEYRIEDSKEASFEVFLFAEAIREMFDRQHAFSVYHALQVYKEHEIEATTRKEALTAAITAAAEAAAAAAAAAAVAATAEGEGAATPAETGDTTAPKPEVKAVEETPAKPVEKEKEKEIDERELLSTFKVSVGNPELFTSFAYFDTNVAGYLMERDLEEVLQAMGLRVSRGDIYRVLKRFAVRERVNYRPYVDRYVGSDGEVKYVATPREDAPSLADILKVHAKDASSTESTATTGASDETPTVTDDTIVIYNGAALNIKHSLDQYKEIKESYNRLASQVQEQEHVIKNYKEQVDTLEKKKKRLDSDVAHYKKKAYDAEKCLKTNEDDVVLLKAALQDCKRLSQRIKSTVERVMPVKERTKEPESAPKSKEGSVVARESSAVPQKTTATTTAVVTEESTPSNAGDADQEQAAKKEGESTEKAVNGGETAAQSEATTAKA